MNSEGITDYGQPPFRFNIFNSMQFSGTFLHFAKMNGLWSLELELDVPQKS